MINFTLSVRVYAFCCWVIAAVVLIFASKILQASGLLLALGSVPTLVVFVTIPFIAGFAAAANWAQKEPEIKARVIE